MARNPFADPAPPDNPWASNQDIGGPRYGNAYEDDQHNRPPPYQQPPSSTTHHWNESNKTGLHAMDVYNDKNNAWDTTSYQPTGVQDAYQFAGKAVYGNQPDTYGTAYSSVPSASPAAPSSGDAHKNTAGGVAEEGTSTTPVSIGNHTGHPSKARLGLRAAQLITGVGHLGFAAGASPYSNHDIPLSSTSCFYFLYVVAILSIIWSLFTLFMYCYRRLSSAQKLKRPVMLGIDALLAILWGAGAIVAAAKFKCAPGGYSGWCDFYNVSIFWGMLAFLLYVVAVGWDFIGACRRSRH